MFLQVQSCKLGYLYDQDLENTNIKCVIILSVSCTFLCITVFLRCACRWKTFVSLLKLSCVPSGKNVWWSIMIMFDYEQISLPSIFFSSKENFLNYCYFHQQGRQNWTSSTFLCNKGADKRGFHDYKILCAKPDLLVINESRSSLKS